MLKIYTRTRLYSLVPGRLMFQGRARGFVQIDTPSTSRIFEITQSAEAGLGTVLDLHLPLQADTAANTVRTIYCSQHCSVFMWWLG